MASASASAQAEPAKADLTVKVEGLRNGKGVVLLCLTQRTGAAFLKCDADPKHVARKVAAGASGVIRLTGLAPGQYSLLLIHDEDSNGKLDTMMKIPTEGFGFSRNPGMRMGPPTYDSVNFALPAGASEQVIKVRYLL